MNLQDFFKGLTEETWINMWTCILLKYFVCIATTLPAVFSGDDELVFVKHLSKEQLILVV